MIPTQKLISAIVTANTSQAKAEMRDLSKEIKTVYGDVKALNQVLLNSMSNRGAGGQFISKKDIAKNIEGVMASVGGRIGEYRDLQDQLAKSRPVWAEYNTADAREALDHQNELIGGQIRAKKAIVDATREMRRFKGEWLGLMLFSMMVQRTMNKFWSALMTTYMSIAPATDKFRQGILGVSGAFEFLKYSLMETIASSPAFMAFIDMFIGFIDSISEFATANPVVTQLFLGLAAAITALAGIGVVGGAIELFYTTSLVQLISGLGKATVATTALNTAIGTGATATAAGTGIMASIAAWGAALAPSMPLLVGLAALATALWLIKTDADAAKTAMDKVTGIQNEALGGDIGAYGQLIDTSGRSYFPQLPYNPGLSVTPEVLGNPSLGAGQSGGMTLNDIATSPRTVNISVGPNYGDVPEAWTNASKQAIAEALRAAYDRSG